MNYKTLFVLLLFILSLGTVLVYPQQSQAQPSQAPASPPDSRSESYIIGPQDLLSVSVFGVSELNTTVRVSEDGTVTLPLMGIITVGGLTRSEVEKKIALLLEENYLKEAQVTIFIKEYQSKQVLVIGAVKSPGSYTLIGSQTLLQMIAKAGWLGNDASNRITVFRHPPGGEDQIINIDLQELLGGEKPLLNMLVEPGDIITVQEELFIDIYITGEVRTPGHIRMARNSQTTLLRAIAQAGGFTERARKSGVYIRREVNRKELKIRVNVKKILSGSKNDFPLKANDVIVVPESLF